MIFDRLKKRSPEPPTHTNGTTNGTMSNGTASSPHNSTRRLKILCFHGSLGSASVMRQQATSAAAILAPYADLVFMDAPSLALGGRGWWQFNYDRNGKHVYEGWERTLQGVRKMFETQGPFDGIFGFSQGAILASILCGLRTNPNPLNYPYTFQFDFAILVGGFMARDLDLSVVYNNRAPYSLPSLHVVGRSDGVVSPEATLEMSELFPDRTYVVHE